MAISVEAQNSGVATSGTTNSITFSITPAGSDRALLVFAFCYNNGDFLSGGTCTFNGSSLGSPLATIGTGSNRGAVWAIAAPAATTANVVVTATANAVFVVQAVALSGVDQSAPFPDTSAAQSGFATSPYSVAVTTPSGGLAVDFFSYRQNGGTITENAGQTQIGSDIAISGSAVAGASYRTDASAMEWSFSGASTNAGIVTVALEPAAAADVTAPVLSSPTGTTTGSTTATIGATTDEANGTLYGFVSTSATPPSDADLKAGTGAVWAGSAAVSSTGAKTLSATGLTASTGYYGHLLHADAAANDSNTVTSAQFTTASGGSSIAAISSNFKRRRA